eukprot:6195701-Pleurochrysis_carterae.AAC.2
MCSPLAKNILRATLQIVLEPERSGYARKRAAGDNEALHLSCVHSTHLCKLLLVSVVADSVSAVCFPGQIAQAEFAAMDSDSSNESGFLDCLLARNVAPLGYKLKPCAEQAELNASVLLSASDDSNQSDVESSACARGVELCMPCAPDKAS